MNFWFNIAFSALGGAFVGYIIMFIITFVTEHYSSPVKENETMSQILSRQFKYAAIIFGIIGALFGWGKITDDDEMIHLRDELYARGYQDAVENTREYARANLGELYIVDGDFLKPIEIDFRKISDMMDINRANEIQ
ncbi:hypothetical protein [Intestinibacillus massiliensis]